MLNGTILNGTILIRTLWCKQYIKVHYEYKYYEHFVPNCDNILLLTISDIIDIPLAIKKNDILTKEKIHDIIHKTVNNLSKQDRFTVLRSMYMR